MKITSSSTESRIQISGFTIALKNWNKNNNTNPILCLHGKLRYEFMQLKNKKAIITGGNQGIGKGIALALARAGADIVIQYRAAEDKAISTVDEIKKMGRLAFAIQSDFTEKNSPETFLN